MNNRGINWVWRTLRFSGLFVREIIGWALLLLGLVFFRSALQYLNAMGVIEGFVVATMGIVLVRSGLQLVKVSVAARALRAEQNWRYTTAVGEKAALESRCLDRRGLEKPGLESRGFSGVGASK